MKQQSRWSVACTALLCILCVGLAYGASNGQKVKINGLITGRDGENLTLKNTKDQTTVVVVLTDTTRVTTPKGVLGLRKAEQAVTALIPGLRIQVEGIGSDNRVVAKNISFTPYNLQLAETIQAGLTPTQQNVAANQQNIQTNKDDIAANKVQTAANRDQIATNQQDIASNQQEIQATTQRFSELSEYDTKGKAFVYFASGSSTISASDQAALTQLAQLAVGLTGYIVQVKGYADSSGNAAMNQRLSMDRAQAVVAYLLQNCNVPLRHIVAPGAMGIADPAAPNETPDGRQENRRVEVKVLINKGLAGGM
ncbi:MAG TPA: OmpA family protein [Terriglobales bacterium]|jgi:OOP family OmpA-OmpF porin|nr:OmpA family protein [Terriglobales bacterium]